MSTKWKTLMSLALAVALAGCATAAQPDAAPAAPDGATQAAAPDDAAQAPAPDAAQGEGASSARELLDALVAASTLISRFPTLTYNQASSRHGFTAPTADRFEWTSDTAATQADLAIVLAAEPLVRAGLDVQQLRAAGWMFREAAAGDGGSPAVLIKSYEMDDAPAGPGSEPDEAGKAFARIVGRFAGQVGYQADSGRYAFTLPGGDRFEWIADPGPRGIDMALVLVAEPLVQAGLDVRKVQQEGWLYQEAAAGDHPTPALLIRPIRLD